MLKILSNCYKNDLYIFIPKLNLLHLSNSAAVGDYKFELLKVLHDQVIL